MVCPWCYVGKAREARQLGISGVPFFVLDMALGVSGAQATETFTSALNQAWAHRG